MWWIEAWSQMFEGMIPSNNYSLFRVLFGIAVLIKVGREYARGHHEYFGHRGFLRFLYEDSCPRLPVSEAMYRATFVVKGVAASMLVAGVGVRVASAAMALALLVEIRIYFRFHANLYFLVALTFAAFPPRMYSIAPHAVDIVGALLGDESPRHLCSPLGPAFIVVTMCVIYWCTAIRKMNPAFLRGLVVYHHLRSVLQDRRRRKCRDGWYPRALVDFMLHADRRRALRVISPLMWMTIAAELALPLLLSCSETYWVGVAVGVALHLGFTLMFPLVLASFSLATISIYLLFADPRLITFVG